LSTSERELQTKHFFCSILPTEVAKANRSNDDELLIALRHPLRRRILRTMVEKEAISPAELSLALEAPLSSVSYHVRVLADCAAVTLVRTVAAPTSTQSFYSLAIEAQWARKILGIGERGDEGGGESSGGAGT
jgi:DNA-binding transcriptional ArsR family regulator